MKDFLERATNALNLGFSVIPILPQTKDPATALAPRGASSRTRNVNLIQAWAENLPNANVGVCSDEEITILESDDEEKFRAAVRSISREMFGDPREVPRTLTSQARPNRPHWFFKNTDRTKERSESPGIGGLYEWRHSNQYVVGPGSVHPTGAVYKIVAAEPIVEMPDWLVDVLDAMKKAYRGERNAASAFVKVGAAATLIDAYSKKFKFDIEAMFADKDLKLEVEPGERHYFLMSMASVLHDGDREEHEIYALLLRLQEKYCIGAKGDKEVKRVAEWIIKREPCSFGPTGFWLGLTWFRDENDYLKAKLAQKDAYEVSVVRDVDDIEEETLESIPYPNVWKGTLYDDFAETCGRGNKIPKEFFIESVKTIMGALMGSSVSVQTNGGELTGASPRFYTVLIARGQGGKGTSINWALKLFEQVDNTGTLLQVSPLWWGSTDPKDVPWTICGACHSTFNSVPGLGRLSRQPRLLQTYEELSTLINNTGMDASGEGLLAVLRSLYDETRYHVGATGRRDPFSGNVLHSMLAGTTPELWRTMFSKKQVEGSGLFQRFNIVPVDRVERVTLYNPKLTKLQGDFFDILRGLEEEPVTMFMPETSIQVIDDWYTPIANGIAHPDIQDDDFGRLNVLAYRNALHLAFMRGKREIGRSEAEDAVKLSDYQLAVRLRYKPASGENEYARVEEELRILLRSSKKMSLRDAKRKLRRHGSKAVDFAVAALEDEITKVESVPPNGGRSMVWLVWNYHR